MLSELAIFAPEEFSKLVKLSKDALEGKVTKESKEVKEVAAKVEKKVEEAVDYAKLTVAELKSLCKEKGIEVLATMKKNDLVDALKK